MSDSPRADAWFNGGFQIPWGSQPADANDVRTESIASSVVATNRNSVEANNGVKALLARPAAPTAAEIEQQILNGQRLTYQNQGDGKGTNSFAEMTIATNGQTYRNGYALADLARVAAENNKLLRAVAGALKLDVTAILAPATAPTTAPAPTTPKAAG